MTTIDRPNPEVVLTTVDAMRAHHKRARTLRRTRLVLVTRLDTIDRELVALVPLVGHVALEWCSCGQQGDTGSGCLSCGERTTSLLSPGDLRDKATGT